MEAMGMEIRIITMDITMLHQDITEVVDIGVMMAIIIETTLIITMIMVFLITMIATITPEEKYM
jgi:hypothetical protein